ncbi:DASH family cryptochrome [Imperialibacter roseus]|uniref:Cryptochrome DASH n=1 Tax=Imperialibacter roseus TaxID=1324217 RepID=A0ABZ0IP11_9BACT|nr:DASH family cryptochrome [Imperialibacter roseus]WOK06188.1 DASH family cryptochrome [Imperialibacter roseus]|tara:strand:+ start:64030 stop:65454 length:1425 start_codon:yes stop_codon:yes gene_type:complete
MEKGIHIIWFRNDLRLLDNEVLLSAMKQCQYLYPVFVFDPRQFEEQSLGFPRCGPLRTNFLLESLTDLKANLQKKGSNLIVRFGLPENIIPELATQLEATAVFASKEVATEEVAIEKSLESTLFRKKILLKLFWQSTLWHEDDIPWPIQNLPEVFTQFRKENENATPIRPAKDAPAKLPAFGKVDAGQLPDLRDFGLQHPGLDERAAIHFSGGENAALERLRAYLWDTKAITQYKNTRNGLLGSNYSTKLSAWLSLGTISPRYVYYEVKKFEQEVLKNDSTYWLIFELYWRDYFRFVMKKYGSSMFRTKGIRGQPIYFVQDMVIFELWRTGKTGVPFIDANMRELLQTGFMSNRGRQNVASFLIKDLQVDWVWGAQWFESQLIDYDVSSNWGNWNYVAGVGNDPRENRYFNILSQAMKYDGKGDYVRHWLPELSGIPGGKVHRPDALRKADLFEAGVQLPESYPLPIVDSSKWI